MNITFHHTVSVGSLNSSMGARLVNFGAGIIEALKKRAHIHVDQIVGDRKDYSVNDCLFTQSPTWRDAEMNARN